MLVAFTTVFCVMPQESVQAATTVYFNWRAGGYTDDSRLVQVEKGAADFYIGDYVNANLSGDSYKACGYLSNCSGVTYSSSNKTVADVNSSTGKVTAKKAGTATITVKFKGATTKCKVQVVSSLKSVRPYDYDQMKSMAAAVIKAYGKGITTKNRYSVLSAVELYEANVYTYSAGYTSAYTNGKSISCIYLPAAGHAYALADKLEEYGDARNPFGTDHSKVFTVSSISGKNKTVTVKLSGKVTAEQIFGALYATSRDTKVSSAKTVEFPICVMDQKTKHRYYAEAVIKQGSNVMTITTRTLQMKKGTSYQLKAYGSASTDWLVNGKISFKAK